VRTPANLPRPAHLLAAAAALGLAACGGADPEVPSAAQSAEALNLSGRLTGSGQLWGHDRPTLGRTNVVQVDLGERPPADFVPRDRFCSALADALCGSLEQCGCDEDKTTCAQDVEVDCQGNYGMLGPQATDAIRQDRVSYDGFAAFRFLRTLGLGTGDCQTPLATLGWDRQDMLTFGGIFRGHLPPGAACNLPFAPFRANECLGGVCMLDGNDQGQCAPAMDVGDTCTEGAVCFDMEAPVSFRTFVEGTFFGRCEEQRHGAPVCVRRAADLEACEEDDACASGRCVARTCIPKSAPGERCIRSTDCAAGSCRAGTCYTPELALGEACQRHADCASEACRAGVCAEPICGR
jgi:hypothetical protein